MEPCWEQGSPQESPPSSSRGQGGGWEQELAELPVLGWQLSQHPEDAADQVRHRQNWIWPGMVRGNRKGSYRCIATKRKRLGIMWALFRRKQENW